MSYQSNSSLSQNNYRVNFSQSPHQIPTQTQQNGRLHSHSSQKQMTKQDYMLIKNIPLPQPVRRGQPDKESKGYCLPPTQNPCVDLSQPHFGGQNLRSEYEQYGRSQSSMIGNQNQESVLQLKALQSENDKLKQQNEKLVVQLNTLSAQIISIQDEKKYFNQSYLQRIMINEYEQRIVQKSSSEDSFSKDLKSQLDQEKKNSDFYRMKYSQINQEIQKINDQLNSQMELENKAVLMAQEIERLKRMMEEKNREIEQWKLLDQENKMKFDTQSKLIFQTQFNEINIQHQQEIFALEDQITSYKARVNDIKSQLEQYITELNKSNQRYSDCYKEREELFQDLQRIFFQYKRDNELLKLQLNEKERDVINLNERIQIIENKYTIQISEAKSSFELTKRSVFDKELRELTIKFNNDKQVLESQIRNLNQKLIEAENKIVLVSQENERMHLRYNDKNQELEQVKSKLLALTMERQKIFAECEDWKTNYQSLESSYHHKLEDIQAHFENQMSLRIRQEMDSLSQDANQKFNDKDIQYQRLNQAYMQSLQRVLLQSFEIERQTNQNELLQQDYDDFMHHYKLLQQEYSEQMEEMKLKLRSQMNSQIDQMKAEMQKEESRQQSSLQRQLQEYQEKLALLAQENERLNGQLKLKESQHQKQIQKLTADLEQQEMQQAAALQQVFRLSLEIERLLVLKQQLSQIVEEFPSIREEFERKYEKNLQHQSQMENFIEQLKAENTQLFEDHATLQNWVQTEIHKKDSVIKEHLSESERMENFYRTQLANELNQGEQDKMRILVQSVEIERLQVLAAEYQQSKDQAVQSLYKRIQEKDNEIEEFMSEGDSIQRQLRQSLEEKEYMLAQQQQKVQNLEGQFQQLQRKQKEKDQQKDQLILQLTDQIDEKKVKIDELLKEIQELEQKLTSSNSFKDSQINQLVLKIQDLEEQLAIVTSQCLMLRQQKEDLENREKKMINDLEIQKNQINQLKELLNQSRLKDIDQETKMQFYQNELERLEEAMNDKTSQCEELESERNNLLGKLHDKDQQLRSFLQSQEEKEEEYCEKINHLQNQLQNLGEKNSQLNQQLAKKSQEFEELFLQCETYNQEISILSQTSYQVKDLELKFEEERVAWESQRDRLQDQIKGMQKANNSLSSDIRRVNGILESKNREIEELRNRLLDNQIHQDYDTLQKRFVESQERLDDLEQKQIKMNSVLQSKEKQIMHLQSELEGKQSEIAEVHTLIEKKRKEGEMFNRETDASKKYLKDLQIRCQNQESQMRTYEQQIENLQNENEEIKESVQQTTLELKQDIEMKEKKIKELNDKIIDYAKQLQQMFNQGTTQSQTLITNSKVSTTSSSYRMNLKQSTQNENENNSFEQFTRMKSSTSVPPKPERQVMGQINKDFTQN